MGKFELQRGHKAFLGMAALAFVGSAIGGWFTWQSVQDLKAEEEGLQGEVTVARGKIARIDDLEKDIIILRENVEEYVRILPSDADVNAFYNYIQDFVDTSGVSIIDLKPEPQRGRLSSSTAFDRAEYTMRFEGTFHQMLQFLNRIENHERFVSIDNFKVRAGERDWETGEDTRHEVSLKVVTYVYKGGEVGNTVQITNYDSKKVQLLEQIQEQRHDFSLERFQLLTDGVRRDPLVDPRVRITGDEVAGANLDEQQLFLDDLRGQVEECNALLGLMEEADNVMREMELRVEALGLLSEIGVKVDGAEARNYLTVPVLRRQFDQEILPDLANLRVRAGQASKEQRPDEELERMQGALTQMAQAFEMGDYDACLATYDTYIIVAGTSNHPELQAIQREMEDLFMAASTALDFMKLQIEIAGVVVYPDRQNEERESVAIVNDIVYREGEAIADDLFLMEISEDHIVFEYRGVPLTFDY